MIKLRLEELMKEYDITPIDLKDILELNNEKMVYKWLSGKNNPDMLKIVKLADYFNCSIEYLIGRTEDNSCPKSNEIPPFDKQLKKVMEEKSVSQYSMQKDKIAYPNNFTRWTVQKALPQIETLIKLADYLQVTVDYLVGRE